MIKDFKKRKLQAGLVGLLSLSAMTSGFAAPLDPNLNQLSQFLLNLGSYIGYDLTQPGPTPPVSNLADGTTLKQFQQNAVQLYLGTILMKPIIDTQSPLASALNQFANMIFKNGVFSTPSTGQQSSTDSSGVTVNNLIDQTPYQNDPVEQSIMNTLTTPDYSYCKMITSCPQTTASNQGTDLASRCCGTPGRAQYQIGVNVVGNFPQTTDVFDAVAPSVLNQLNGNTLINPLMYGTTSNNTNNSDSNGASSSQQSTIGLQANTQAQEAENFIRYVTGSVAPTPKTKADVYDKLQKQATTVPNKPTAAQIEQMAAAQSALSTYLAALRVSAAQASVGVSNLYYILSKRMSQTPSSGTVTSQALSEYTMATRRLYDPVTKSGPWLDQINNASPATVQKEIAVLLSEINYQLYLTRQQQERLLLTNTVMLFQLSHLVEPTPLQPPTQ